MSFLPLVLGFLLFKMLPAFNGGNANKSGNKTDSTQKKDTPFGNIDEIQNALQLVSVFNKIKDKKADIGDIMGEVLSNPLAMELLKRFGNTKPDTSTEDATVSVDQEDSFNDKETQQDTDSKSSEPSSSATDIEEQTKIDNEELFKPVENIAGVELTEKLKQYYDNWYIKS